MKGATIAFIFTLAAIYGSLTDDTRAEDACPPLRQVASVEMSTGAYGEITIPLSISGHQINSGIATDEQFSFIKSSSAAGFGMPLEPIKAYELGAGDTRLHNYAIAQPMKLGQMAGRVRFVVMPDQDVESDMSAVLSSDFLKNYDVEFDYGQDRLNLYSPAHCPGGVIYWTHDPAARIPMEVDAWGRVQISTELDGKPLRATLATETGESTLYMWQNETMFADQMSQWKVVDNDPGVAVGYQKTETDYEHTFKSLSLEGLAIGNPTIKVKSVDRIILKPMLYIGMDVLRRLHLYLAYKESNLYATSASAH